MSLPATIARCPGQNSDAPAGEWPFPRQQQDCLMQCARRRQGIADYMAGEKVTWMAAPAEVPCPEMLRAEK